MGKLVLFLVLLTSCLCFNSRMTEDTDGIYTFSSPAYYSYSPVYYSYVPASYYYSYDPYFGYYGSSYYLDYTYVVYPFYYRGTAPNTNDKKAEKKESTTAEMKSELKNLKKEIWGKDSFDTTELRKNNRAYDSRWLIAQLKITRALELEDNLKKMKKENPKRVDDELDEDEELRKKKKKMEESKKAEKKKKKKKKKKDADKKKKKKRKREDEDKKKKKKREDESEDDEDEKKKKKMES